MPVNSIQKVVAIAEEASFAAVASPDWETLAGAEGLMAVTEVEDSALRRAYIENENITRRPGDRNARIRGLRSGATAQISAYVSGLASGHAALGSQAAANVLDTMLRAAYGGQHLGYAADITGGTAANPTTTGAHGDNIEPWSWGYFWDDNGGPDGNGAGEFKLIESVTDGGAGDDTLSMAPGHDLSFVPEAADEMRAVRVYTPHWDALEDHSHADHTTLTMLLQGRHEEDLFELKGVKPAVNFEAIEQGVAAKISIPLMLAYFLHNEIALPGPTLAQALQGQPGDVIGSGRRTTMLWAAADAAFASAQFWGTVQPTLGVQHEHVVGPNGIEGVHGYGVAGDSYKAGQLELMADFTRAFRAEAEAAAERHLLLQIGNALTDGVWGMYFPQLSYSDDAEVGSDRNARRQNTLRYDLRERQTLDETGLTEAQIHRARAKFAILLVG